MTNKISPHVCNHNALPARWETETRESLDTMVQLACCTKQVAKTNKQTNKSLTKRPILKVEGGPTPKIVLVYTQTHTHTHTPGRGSEKIRKQKDVNTSALLAFYFPFTQDFSPYYGNTHH